MFKFTLLFSLLLVAKTVTASCPPNTTEWQSNCFSFFSNATGFADAELTCKQAGGHLASIHDGFANALLAQEANKHLHESTITDFWIGATNLLGGKAWNWTDGSGIDFTDWKKGDPQNVSGSNCAALSISDGYWTAEDCFKTKPFACSVSTTPTYPLTANCSQGWTYFAPTHSCYGVNANGLVTSWTLAENYCEKNDSHLPSIHSFAEYQYLTSYLYEAWYSIWTGIYSPDSGVTWKTSDGTDADFLKYGQWCYGNPKNTTGERCVAIYAGNPAGCYYDYDCTSSSMRTLCKKPLFV